MWCILNHQKASFTGTVWEKLLSPFKGPRLGEEASRQCPMTENTQVTFLNMPVTFFPANKNSECTMNKASAAHLCPNPTQIHWLTWDSKAAGAMLKKPHRSRSSLSHHKSKTLINVTDWRLWFILCKKLFFLTIAGLSMDCSMLSCPLFFFFLILNTSLNSFLQLFCGWKNEKERKMASKQDTSAPLF